MSTKFHCQRCGQYLEDDPVKTNAFGWCSSCQSLAQVYGPNFIPAPTCPYPQTVWGTPTAGGPICQSGF